MLAVSEAIELERLRLWPWLARQLNPSILPAGAADRGHVVGSESKARVARVVEGALAVAADFETAPKASLATTRRRVVPLLHAPLLDPHDPLVAQLTVLDYLWCSEEEGRRHPRVVFCGGPISVVPISTMDGRFKIVQSPSVAIWWFTQSEVTAERESTRRSRCCEASLDRSAVRRTLARAQS